METSFESSLLCAEEETSIFYDNSEGIALTVDDSEVLNWQYRDQPNNKHKLRSHKDNNFLFTGHGDCLDPFQMPSEEFLASMFQRETQHLPSLHYLNSLRIGDLDLSARKQAIHWIQQVQSHYNFGPLSVYLAVNYLDRFLSAYELPKDKAWMVQLLAVACLSLAAKMEETNVPLSLDLQVGEAKFIFEAKTIQRMELLVLSTLKWRMQAVTPFSFIDYFLHKINGDHNSLRSLLSHSTQLILSTIKGIDFLEFRPSEIAAAVAISVREEETQIEENPIELLSLLSHHVQKERVERCVELIQDLIWSDSRCKNMRSSASTSISVPQSPNGVLDADACLSCTCDDASTIYTPSLTHSSPAPKRRKLART